tara:strand:- start:1273 stop:1908 length:636 start_codon:yes stop_codon:yes gene_type:complete
MSTATKIKKNITRKNLKKEYGKIHDRVINVSKETVEVTVDNLEKWQNMFSKGFTASTPLVEKGIDLSFTVAETLWDQYRSSGQRVKSLLGLGKNENITNKVITAAPKATISTSKTKKVTAFAPKTTALTPKTKKVTGAPKTKTIKTPSKLTDITGIGPKIAGLLNEVGIKSIADLATAKMETLEKVLKTAGPRFQMHDSSTWVNQAKAITK